MKNKKEHNHEAEECQNDEVTAQAAAEVEAPEKGDGEWDAVPEEPAAPAEPEKSEEEKLREAVADLQAKYLYLQAEYQNYRKRVARMSPTPEAMPMPMRWARS